MVVKAMKEEPNHTNAASPLEEIDSLIGVLRKKFDGNNVKAIQIKKFAKEVKRYGLIDSGATNNVREAKDNENFKGIAPIEVEAAK